MTKKKSDPSLRALQVVPGVGPSIAQDLLDLGIRSVSNLAGRDPEALYNEHCALKGALVDRCWLYVARCAVYYASHPVHDPEKLKWWNWKDSRVGRERAERPGSPRSRSAR